MAIGLWGEGERESLLPILVMVLKILSLWGPGYVFSVQDPDLKTDSDPPLSKGSNILGGGRQQPSVSQSTLFALFNYI